MGRNKGNQWEIHHLSSFYFIFPFHSSHPLAAAILPIIIIIYLLLLTIIIIVVTFLLLVVLTLLLLSIHPLFVSLCYVTIGQKMVLGDKETAAQRKRRKRQADNKKHKENTLFVISGLVERLLLQA